MVGISRKVFKVWLSCSIVWIIAFGIFVNTADSIPAACW